MKQSTFTGRFIFDTITRLQNELNELGKACDMVSDKIGQSSLVYKLLNDQYQDKKKELNSSLNAAFISE